MHQAHTNTIIQAHTNAYESAYTHLQTYARNFMPVISIFIIEETYKIWFLRLCFVSFHCILTKKTSSLYGGHKRPQWLFVTESWNWRQYQRPTLKYFACLIFLNLLIQTVLNKMWTSNETILYHHLLMVVYVSFVFYEKP